MTLKRHLWSIYMAMVTRERLDNITLGHGMAVWPQPTAQRHSWSSMVTLNPMVLEDSLVMFDILMKSS